jgi:diguanylate cyclase (GGDEF)-like protein
VARAVRFNLRYAALGGLLAMGAPGGWLVLQMFTARTLSPVQELVAHAPLYAYLLVSATAAFATFGGVLGRAADEREKLIQRLRAVSKTDALTGLNNAREFHDRLEQECARATRSGAPLALIMIDLDRFKEVNDRYGHDVGDGALVHVADIMRRDVRRGDVLCRVGGEEFAVICPATADDAGVDVATRICDALRGQPLALNQDQVRITASLGVAMHNPARRPADLYKAADQALYLAKMQGRDRVQVAWQTLV